MTLRKNRREEVFTDPNALLEDEENKEIATAARIHAPIVWGDGPPGILIQDIPHDMFEDVITLLKEHFITNQFLFQNTDIMNDPESEESYLEQCRFQLNDHCSICALEEGTNILAGVLIIQVVDESDYGKVFSRTKIMKGKSLEKITQIRAFLNRKTNLYAKYNCTQYLRMYDLAVHPDFRGKGLGLALMRAAKDVSKSLNVPVIMSIISTGNLQSKAKKIGMEVISEQYYMDWLENGEMVFSDPGIGNYTMALLAGTIPLNDDC